MPDEQPTLWDRLTDEFDRVLGYAESRQEVVEPTDEEAANGWTAETLTLYLAERAAAQSLTADPRSLHSRMSKRPKWANNKFNPMRWRG